MRAVKANPDGNSYAMSMLLGSGGSIQEPDIDPGLHKSQGPKLTRTHTTELLTDSDVCEEVAVLGRRVVWAAGRSLRKSLTLQSEVIQKAVWTDFPEYGHRAVLCLLQPGCVTTCLAGGGLQDTPLASPVEHIWPCTLGLLLGSPHASGVRMITHPLDEPCPVLADVSLRAGCEGSYAGWSGEEVVWSSRSLPFVATHSKGAGRLALWLITKRAVRPTAIGNLPDLPAATPHPLHHLADTTPVNQVVSRGGSRPPSTAAAVPGAHTTSASMLDTPVSGGPASVAASGFSGWPSSVKRPVARTPEGRLSPSMFNPAPRGANTGLSLPALVKAGKAIGGFGASDARTVGREAPGSRVQAGLNTGLTGSRAIGADAGSLFDGAVSSVGVQMSRSGGLSLGGRSMSPVDPSGAASLEDSYLPLTGLPGLDGPRPVFCLLHEHDMQQVAVDAKPTEGHEVTDASGGLLLAVLCPDAQQLLVFTLPTTPAGRPGLHTCHPSQLPALAFTLPARAVAAVRATDTPAPRSPLGGRTMELLVLSPKGQLNVYQGSHQLCGISLPQAASPLQPPLQQQVHLQQTQPRHMQQQQQQQQRTADAAAGAAGAAAGIAAAGTADAAAGGVGTAAGTADSSRHSSSSRI
uniref:Anaphase-promoting complex subunit 1 n=1 Tax=Dunaliella tertiolecta TaxID=3047 RepID=A0A7S3QQP9_DUNTE